MPSTESSDEIQFRPLAPEERDDFCNVGRRAFPLAIGAMISPRDINLVATIGDDLVGGFAAEVVEFTDGSTMAVVRWLFVSPDVQGQGLGSRLAKAGFSHLKNSDIDHFVADIHGDNTSSFRIAESMGARRLRPWDQLRLLGPAKTATAWWKLSHFLDFGYFVYVGNSDGELRDTGHRNAAEISLTLSSIAVLAAIAGWRADHHIGLVATAALGFVALRHIATSMASRLQGYSTTHRAWDSGLPFSLGIALAASVLFPMPGGTYPTDDNWRSRDFTTRRGISALVAVGVLLAVTATSQCILHFDLASRWHPAVQATTFVGTSFLIFDAILATPPFSCFHASHIRAWSTTVWIVTALSALLVIFAPTWISALL